MTKYTIKYDIKGEYSCDLPLKNIPQELLESVFNELMVDLLATAKKDDSTARMVLRMAITKTLEQRGAPIENILAALVDAAGMHENNIASGANSKDAPAQEEDVKEPTVCGTSSLQ